MFETDLSIRCSNVFFQETFNEIDMYEITIERYLCIKGNCQKPIYFLFDRLYLLESNIKLQMNKI